MLAIIHKIPTAAKQTPRSIGLENIAGASLLARQISWLKAVGAAPIVIELGEDEGALQLTDWLLESEEEHLMMVPTSGAVGPRALAARAGHPSGIPFLAVPENVIGDSDLLDVFLESSRGGAIVMFAAPRGVNLPYGSVRVVGELGGFSQLVQGRGWAVRITSPIDAEHLAHAAARGALPTRDRDHFAPLEVYEELLPKPLARREAPWASHGPSPSSGVHIASRPRMDKNAYARIAKATRTLGQP